ncbi:IS200/IS605 family transposase [Enterococcus faecalis]|nr:IS200/IS605 family transposase [Enterococcus faecalis]EGO6705162.1 IS200/IS605 family transposase [Enterococcus faecalis]
MELDTNNHSVFLLYYHLVLVTKYRRQVIDDEISDYAKVTFERISKPYHITLVEWKHDKDHIHIMFKAQPKTELTKFINAYKSASSRLIKRGFPRVKQFLAYKFRIYPTEEQEIFFAKSFGCVRKVYNLMLDDRMKAYEETKNGSSKNEFSNTCKI